MKFNECLQKLRHERGISQKELADSIYVSRSAVAKWESGRGVPNQSSYDAILSYFCITAEELPLEACEEELGAKNAKLRKWLLTTSCIFLAVCILSCGSIAFMSVNGFGFTPEAAVGEYWAKEEFIETDSYRFYYDCIVSEDGAPMIIESVRVVKKTFLGYWHIEDTAEYKREVYNADGERVGKIYSFADGHFCHNFFITDLRGHEGAGLLATVISEIEIKEERIVTFLGSYFVTSGEISGFSSHGVVYTLKK